MTGELGSRTQVTVGPDLAGLRADRALSRVLPQLSRREIQHLCEQGRIWCGPHRLKKSDLLRLGALLDIQLNDPALATPNAQAPLSVRFESPHWVIVSKPGGQPTAPLDPHEVNTLANALVSAYPELAHVGYRPLEPGLLHRLDNGTSGLLVAARTAVAFDAAKTALTQGRWLKRYLAIVNGRDLPAAGSIEGRLQADRRHAQRVALQSDVQVTPIAAESPWALAAGTVRQPDAPHRTSFRVIRRLEASTYVEIAVGAAFRHQIRAHFAAAGWPLVNDEVYGAPAEPALAPQRHALHAARVAWDGEAVFEGFDFTEPLPDDLDGFLGSLGSAAP